MRTSRRIAVFSEAQSGPKFTYTGTYTLIDDGSKNWRIKFLTSGTFTPKKAMTVDLFAVGGGGGSAHSAGSYADAGGGGGYTNTVLNQSLTANTGYVVTIGAGGITATGGTSSFSSLISANGGKPGSFDTGGNGGSGGGPIGGNGGSNGSNGSSGATTNVGLGQGTTTREFGELTGGLYAGGGGGYAANGGAGGGGNSFQEGAANTGGGGGCARNGGSGIVIIRNAR